jgi:hypothetical protein
VIAPPASSQVTISVHTEPQLNPPRHLFPAASRRKSIRETKLNGAVRNKKIKESLARSYPDMVGVILFQATDSYFYHNRRTMTTPEVYELFDNGHIDEAVESLGLRPWVIGRPKLP